MIVIKQGNQRTPPQSQAWRKEEEKGAKDFCHHNVVKMKLKGIPNELI